MVFKAINFGESDCGRKIETSKKRFFWTFSIDGQEHTLELISSFLSGKKKILLDSTEIYSEKKLLNINFQFRHTIEDHSIRITQDMMEFECYIDNESFQALMHRGPYEEKQTKSKIIQEVKAQDPFADFSNCFQKVEQDKNRSDAFDNFGNFNMDHQIENNKGASNFFGQQPKKSAQPIVNKQQGETDFFGFSVKDPEPTNQFFTGQFNTGNNIIFGKDNKPMASDNFFEDEFERRQAQQQKQQENNQKGFFGKVENAFKNLYNQIPSIGKSNSSALNNNADLL